MYEDVIDKLTFSMKEKTKKIRNRKNELDYYKINYIYYFIYLIVIIIFLIQIDKYLSFYFKETVKIFSYISLSLTNISELNFSITFDIIILLYIFYKVYLINKGKKKKLKENYEKLRIEIIDYLNLDIKICLCDKPCNCREEYYMLMNTLNINLSYKN
jgi:hypothetical protein